ncbi:HK97 gp10 family phage protein [Actinomadura sp. DC4]|uniref:HK97 gp10 family phage protein n=1 Tax=Actinomadura sp. DC4 TaxID=3055069 RepID=UPI0025B15356|nr:HK97 gp10 family phage protein [Actinomadura sp. DC4]MDN3356082.1 HK97 gp10 family phage protein [Actinomadura sp. DC4]
MSVQRQELQKLIRDLGAVPPAVRRALRSGGMVKAGQPALLEVRRRAGWSSRIPGATTLQPSSGSRPGITIRVSASKAPHARPYEHDGSPGEFRHPYFGDRRRWYTQAARPFFYPGVQAASGAVAEAVADIVTQVAEDHGF